jgi:flagellar biosynthesis GTPase FlhF
MNERNGHASATVNGNGGSAPRPGSRTYRGRNLEEVLPRIRAELGNHAIVTRQREGLAGGIGGFFQRRFIEIEAVPGAHQVDTYDIEDAAAPLLDPVEEGLQAPGIRHAIEQAAPFADQLAHAEAAPEPVVYQEPVPEPVYEEPVYEEPVQEEPVRQGPAPVVEEEQPAPGRPRAADNLETSLAAAGLSPELAASLVGQTVSHSLPFGTPRQLKRFARRNLAQRMPVPPPVESGGRIVAFVGAGGAGKTRAAARLARAYAAGSDVPVLALALRSGDGGAELAGLLVGTEVPVHAVETAPEVRTRIEAAGDRALVVVDCAGASPSSAEDLQVLAKLLAAAGVEEIHLALPAPLGMQAGRELVAGFEALGLSHIALTHADETSHVGGAVQVAIDSGLPFSYVSSGAQEPGELMPAEADTLAASVVA